MGNSALKRQLTHRLKEGGWEEIRNRGKHAVWAHPNGATFTLPGTSKDVCRHKLNYLASIARLERRAGEVPVKESTVKVIKPKPMWIPIYVDIAPGDLVIPVVAQEEALPPVVELEVVPPPVTEPEVVATTEPKVEIPMEAKPKTPKPRRPRPATPVLSQRDKDIQRIAHILSVARLTDQEVHTLVENLIHDVEHVLLGE